MWKRPNVCEKDQRNEICDDETLLNITSEGFELEEVQSFKYLRARFNLVSLVSMTIRTTKWNLAVVQDFHKRL